MTKKKDPSEKRKVGRPTIYSKKLADLICDRIASTPMGINKMCAMFDDLPDATTIYSWIHKKPEFSLQYMSAKASQAHILAEECLEIADDKSEDTKIDPETGYEVANYEYIARSRLRIDTRKWMAGKLAPKVYGKAAEELSKEKNDTESLLEKLLDRLVDK